MIRRVFSPKQPPPPEYGGHCDSVSAGLVQGWAWRPDAPELRVEVEQWVDGVLKATARADVRRNDLAEAGIGDGAHGWRMLLALDPDKPEPQQVEIRFRGGGPLADGVFEATLEALAPPPEPEPEPEAEPEADAASRAAWGQCDGRHGGVVLGWAWRPQAPEEHVVVEQWVDGLLADETLAEGFRPDLDAARVGHGRYGWSMPLRLDPEKAGPQTVELRIKGAGRLVGGLFELTAGDIEEPAEDGAAPVETAGAFGRCDGLKGSALYGWAWDPARPDGAVEVELWVAGGRVASATADQFRPDLRANRVGTGRYGWRLPVDLRQAAAGPIAVEVRLAGGGPLEDGVLELKNDLALDDPANAPLRPFVEAVLRGTASEPPEVAAQRELTCLAYCPPPTEAGKFWSREYDDYPAARAAFLPALAALGEVVVVETLEEAAALCAERRGDGGERLLFVFGPPRQAPLETPCPIVPVFAWAFPSIPTGCWDGDPRSDWRKVLTFAGRGVALSEFARQAVQAAMGAAFPVAAICPPARETAAGAPAWRRSIRLNGIVFDSRDYAYDPEKPNMPPRVWSGEDEFACGPTVEIDGMLVTAFLDFDDHRKNWADLISAFVTANRDKPDATLLLKLSEPSAGWMSELYKWLAAQPAFACRVLAMRGPLAGEAYDAVIAASHWFASAANAEGLCWPLQDFLAGGRPAIAPRHTAFADLVDAETALVVFADEEDWRWPLEPEDGLWSFGQHPDDVGLTTRWRVSWAGLVSAFEQAYRLTTAEPEAYARLSAAAARRARERCSVEAAAAALRDLLADERPKIADLGPSPLMRELAAE